jgi:hypothetical protein
MLSKTAVLHYACGPQVRPLLILEPQISVSERTAAGDRVDLVVCGLLGRGFTLLRTPAQLAAPARGWQLRLPGSAARLLAPDGEVAYDGSVDPPPGWLDLVRSAGACVVLIGAIGLGTDPGAELTVQDLRRLLNLAARDGALTEAVVTAY